MTAVFETDQIFKLSYEFYQDTLVVWTEADNDLALSFQEKEGCGEIWEKICQVCICKHSRS